MKGIVFWDVVLYSLMEVDRRFRGAYYLHTGAVRTSETSVCFHETTPRDIPESCHLHICSLFNGAFSIAQTI
jgi:hypothetical protein